MRFWNDSHPYLPYVARTLSCMLARASEIDENLLSCSAFRTAHSRPQTSTTAKRELRNFDAKVTLPIAFATSTPTRLSKANMGKVVEGLITMLRPEPPLVFPPKHPLDEPDEVIIHEVSYRLVF